MFFDREVFLMKRFFVKTKKLTAVLITIAVLCSLCITSLAASIVVANAEPGIVAAEDSQVTIDNENMLIIGVREGTSTLEGIVEITGNGRLVYSNNGAFNKDTTVSVYNSSYTSTYGVYGIVFRGDVDRDGAVDQEDLNAIASVATLKTNVDSDKVQYAIMDVNADGYIDVQDLLFAKAIFNGVEIDENIPEQDGGIDEDYWGDV